MKSNQPKKPEPSKSETRNALIFLAALIAGSLAWCGKINYDNYGNVVGSSSQTATTASAPAKSIPAIAKCESAAGNIWSGVNLYSNSECSTLTGFVMGAKSGAQTIKISIDGGGDAWYSRDDVKRLYIKSDDPAIARMKLAIVD
jgi:hypothetical protein